MSTEEIREKYLNFFKKNDHAEITPSPLVIDSDPTTLFTSSGMQQLVPYLKGEKHPKGKRLADSQPSLRLQDLEEVGDNRHTTFFEMLGNWSLGDYFKEEQLKWIWKFYTEELGISSERLHVSVFEGDGEVPKDTESFEIWKKIGVPENHIHFYDAKKNWWSRAGIPQEMPPGEIGGPDSEIFYEFEDIAHRPEFGSFCHPNCDCGKFLEIGNSVFMQYQKTDDGKLIDLPQKNVDFGGGLERVSAALLNNPDIFAIDIFSGVIGKIEKETGRRYGSDISKDVSYRVIADHLRAAVNLLAEGVIPGNKLHGYVLRRLVRRAMFHFHLLGSGISGSAVSHIAEEYRKYYPNVDKNWQFIDENLTAEATRFEAALKRGLAKLTRAVSEGVEIDGKFAFDLYQTEGFPLELSMEILKQNGMNFTRDEKNSFEEEFEKHKSASRSASAGMFKGGLAEASEITTKLHTATHVLHAALRQVLGEHVGQKGSHITNERLRFDFSNQQKLSDKEIGQIEDLINLKIAEDLPVTFSVMSLPDAIASGAMHFFAEKYGQEVKVYTVGDPKGIWFSKEVCGGPHVTHTGEIGGVKIIKQEKIGSGIIRLYATIK
ncbi:MAG: alanyl-tRNA synthetase, alanyl-tRNA synthetase [Microgenomates group bacterium GW2011_GWC1_41_20]|nr:MAG: alanyl-tRNA synthetase, alanyl-tRNA synthetase [Microgenomates group bacterium GW2011_GWC1_41_20]